MSMEWDEILSDNGIMMEEGEAAKAIALGISAKTALSGGTTSVDVSGMCSSLFERIDWGFCDAVDQVISVIAPRFVDGSSMAYSSDIGELISVAGFTTAVYGATNGEVRLRGGGMLFDSEWIKQRKGVLNLFVNAGTPVEDAVFTKTSLNSNTWTVTGSSVSGATVTLPHTLNPIDTTPTSYFRGAATYSTNVTLDSSKRYYLYLEPVYQRADVVLNGSTASTLEIYGATSSQHTFTVERPGIPTVIDLTAIPFANGGNTLTVVTDNTATFWNIPFDGLVDCYNMLGGATLCEAGLLCFDPVTYGTRRCHLTTGVIGVTVKFAVKCNSNQTDPVNGYVTAAVYVEGSTTALYSASLLVEVDPGETESCFIDLSLKGTASSNVWNIGDGKRFRVEIKLYSPPTSDTPVDTIEDYFGYRTFSAEKHDSTDGGYGLTLNGSTMSLYGVGYHHWDRTPTTDEMDADWAIISALKPKMIRFAYFPALHYLLDKCDQAGIAVMLEIPWMHDFHNGEWPEGDMEGYRNAWRLRYQHNTTANAVAMANEFYNHPSVLFYCIGTGFGIKIYHEWYPLQMRPYITDELLPAIHAVDTSRLVCIELASIAPASGVPVSWTDVGDIIMERMNSGWGSGSIGDAVSEANTWNGRNATIPMAIMDWSYGANPAHHVEWSSASTKPSDTSTNGNADYPEEYQAYCVEQYAGSALTLNWPVFQLYGTVFDYAAANVSHAGGKSGVMQTGLVTRDRSIFKDAYYYLKAMWNSEPMVYITQKRNVNKTTSPVTLRIYTNCNYVKVYSSSMTLLDTIQRSSGSYVVTKSVELEEGNNLFYVTGHDTSSGASTCNDSVTINYEDTSGTAHILIYSDSAIVNSGRVNYAITGATATPNPTVTWTSETPAIATVNSGGTVTVLSDGTASIAAEAVVDGNTVSKVKSIPCYVRGATDSLYYKATFGGFYDNDVVSHLGLTITRNHDGTETINGTFVGGGTGFNMWPSDMAGTNSVTPRSRAMFPVWNIPGDQLLTAEIIGGTITGTPNGDPIVITPQDQTFTQLPQAALKPLNAINGSGDVNAKLITGSTVGFSTFRVKLNYPSGTVFDNVVLRVQSYKQADEYYDAGILEGHLSPVGTIVKHSRDGEMVELMNAYMRNADGSHSELVPNPNNGTSIPSFARVTDGFACAKNSDSVLLTGSTIAVAGDVLKFTVVMKNWPPYYEQKDENSEWSFVVKYADGTDAARLCWAYGANGNGVDFTGGTASTTFIATKTVDYVGWYRHYFAWGGTLDCTNTVTWQMKLEKLDPSQIPPNTITAYASNHIVNTGYANAVGDPISANQGVTWSSSNTSVATIDSSTGFITVVSDGQCTFTATSVLDSTKTGSVTVSCIKSTTTNMLGTMSTRNSGTSQTVSGVTITNNGDGTYTLNGTTSTASEITIRVVPTANANNIITSYAPKSGVAGDVIVWMEHLGGTVSELSTFSGYDFGVRFYNESNSIMSGYNLNWIEKQTVSGDGQSVLITGSTEGVRRATLQIKRPSGTVFDNYTFRIGLLKYSSLGVVYTGGLLSQSLPALYSMEFLGTKNVPISRNPDGSIFCLWGGSNYPFATSTAGYVKLTNGLTVYDNGSDVPITDVVATSGKTYKFKVQLLESCPIGSNGGASALLEFVVLDVNRTAVAALQHVSSNAITTTFDNGAAETTFTATSNISCVCIHFSGSLRLNPGNLYFAVSLEEVTA
ncbi:MAG: glycoside hydrolase family 2 TIM barrel-domain containing protein [Lentisphaeria bacterium]|nr:glycoside hydrolase family 2 TIM barrel-domain containing protein [Lentisphaeria bacterium]